MLNRRMIAAMAGAGALAASVMLAPTVGAKEKDEKEKTPAQNENACAEYFGEGYVWTSDGSTKTCSGTASQKETTKEAGNSDRGWVVAVTTETTFVRDNNDIETNTVTVDITCTNPGGQVKEGEDLPTHCMIPTP
jgi:hypothetical protein